MSLSAAYAPKLAPRRKVSLARESLVYFVKQFWDQVPGAGRLVWGWHLELFCEELQRAAERVFKGLPREYDLCLNVSPGTSKSTIWSILFPAWVWTRMPEARILTASHTDDLVLDLANKSRHVVKGEKYSTWFPEIVIRDDQDTKGYFANTSGGDRKTSTVAGKSPVGFHAHFIIVDDPIDPKKVLSEVELAAAKQFMVDVLPTRKVDKAATITVLIMQRLGLGDPTDVMLDGAKAEGAVPVRHICLPSELEVGNDGAFLDTWVKPTELANRYVNGLMDPKRLGKRELSQYKARPHYYSTQFLQRPYAPGGGMFKVEWFNQRVRSAPYAAKRVRYWDRASTSDGGCYTAGTLLAKGPDGNCYVEDVVKGQWEPDERNRIMRATALKDRSRYGPKHEPRIMVEDEGGSSGKDANKGVARALAGFRVHFEDVTGSKDVRAEPWAGFLSSGCVYLVDNGESQGTGKAGWDIPAYVEEHVRFRPSLKDKRLGSFKDQVDSSTGGFNWLFPLPGPTGLRSITMHSAKKLITRMVVCTFDELASIVLDQRALLVVVNDPEVNVEEVMSNSPEPADAEVRVGERTDVASGGGNGYPPPDQQELEQRLAEAAGRREVMSNDASVLPARIPSEQRELRTVPEAGQYVDAGGAQPPAIPPHGLDNLLDSVVLTFADLDPAECQDTWDCPVAPWNLPAGELVLRPEVAKKMWSMVLRKRDPAHEVIVFAEPEGRRALSLAEAVRTQLRMPTESIWRPGKEATLAAGGDNKVDPSEVNGHVLAVARQARGLVIG